MAENHMLSAT